jgi:hypothetical protein
MPQPESTQNESSKLKKLLNEGNESPMSRLPRGATAAPSKNIEKPISVTKQEKPRKPLFSFPPKAAKPKAEPKAKPATPARTNYSEWRFLPTFWTIASVISMLVNIGVVIALIFVIYLLGGTRSALAFAQNQANGLLGGLHNNFVKMDAASIKAQIPVSANIPLNITVPVKTTTQITLAEAAVIRNAQVIINTGSLDINASATVTLPANTPLTVNLDFPLQVTDTIPVSLPVDVNIPLNQTELHDPFVGLQKVVEPYYCMLQQSVIVNGIDVCANAAPILPITP